MLPLFQLILLCFTTLLFHVGISNPNLSSIDDHVPYEGFGSTFTVFFGPRIGHILTWISALYQGLYLIFEVISPASIPIVFPQLQTSIDPLPFTRIAILGYILMCIGGFGRIWCYRTLGVFFTFELSIRNTHKLIKTGPYYYVRHPSYTFLCILLIGMFLVHQRLKNFFPNRTWMHVQFGPIGFLLCCLLVTLLIGRRVIREEDELRKKFGKEWLDYASKTKRFLPKII